MKIEDKDSLTTRLNGIIADQNEAIGQLEDI